MPRFLKKYFIRTVGETERSPAVRAASISYRLANGKCGTITDPLVLGRFYSKLYQRSGRKAGG